MPPAASPRPSPPPCFAPFVLVSPSRAQSNPAPSAYPPVVHLTAEQDHQRTLDLLHIPSLRRGRDGNAGSPYAANYDESKANPFPQLPDPLLLNNGRKVTSAKKAAGGPQRRPQIVELFDREIYGRVPQNAPKVTWEVTETKHTTNGDIPIITKSLTGHVDNSSYPLVTVDIKLELTTPANATGPVPVLMEFGFMGPFKPRPGAPPLPPMLASTPGPQPLLAAAGARQRLGLRHPQPHQHPGR